MFKLILFLLGSVVGAGGATSWLVSESGPAGPAPLALNGESLQARLRNLQAQFERSWSEGQRAAEFTEEHLRRKLDAYRKGSRDSAAS